MCTDCFRQKMKKRDGECENLRIASCAKTVALKEASLLSQTDRTDFFFFVSRGLLTGRNLFGIHVFINLFLLICFFHKQKNDCAQYNEMCLSTVFMPSFLENGKMTLSKRTVGGRNECRVVKLICKLGFVKAFLFRIYGT